MERDAQKASGMRQMSEGGADEGGTGTADGATGPAADQRDRWAHRRAEPRPERAVERPPMHVAAVGMVVGMRVERADGCRLNFIQNEEYSFRKRWRIRDDQFHRCCRLLSCTTIGSIPFDSIPIHHFIIL